MNTSNESNILPPDSSCSGDIDLFRNSCSIDTTESYKRNAIAGTRMIVSLLSLVGSLSIIISALYRRQLKSSKVLPLFILSIADSFLSISLIIGGIMWWTTKAASGWCLIVSLLTVVFVCSSANLTVVYSIVCYSNLKKNSIQSMLGYVGSLQSQKTVTLKLAAIYSIAWLFPLFVVIVSFGSLEGTLHVMFENDNCTCWCLPYFANVIPMANPANMGTTRFSFKMEKLVSVLGFIVGTNYLVVFIFLVIMYSKILLQIRKLSTQGINHQRDRYGSIDSIIFRGQRKAKKRILYFLIVFIVTGFANLILSYAMAINELEDILHGEEIEIPPSGGYRYHDRLGDSDFAVYMLQSLTLPLQGFLNALVYGWTRSEFVRRIGYNKTVNHSEKNEEKADRHGLTYSGSCAFDDER